jgi:putative hydrolase of the HAD superfamily
MGTEAVLFDALGTVVELEPPAPRLAAALGIAPDRRLVAAVRTEMAYYRDHAHEGADERSLAELRERCAALLSAELGRAVSVERMMSSIRFRAYPDAGPALAGLRARGLGLVCVSNWDVSLPQVLERCGLGGAFDGVVTSAGSGARKPDPAIFEAALALAGSAPAQTVHVGDSAEEDAAGAAAAGIRCLLIDRDGGGDIESLAEVADRLDR